MVASLDIRQTIRDYIVTNFYVPEQEQLTDDESLFELGLVDSTGIAEILAFLHQTLGVEVDDREILPENLETIERIVSFVKQKKS